MKIDLSSRRQQGFTLIEIMVSLLMGLFLLGGILQVFTQSKKTYRVQEALTTLQENGRMATELLAADIRMAGFIGCSSQAAQTNTLNTSDNYFYRFDKAIEGFDATTSSLWTPALPTGTPTTHPSALGGSDIITLRRIDDQNFTVTDHTTATADITLDASATTENLKTAGFLKASDGTNNCALAAISDCSSTVFFQVSGIANKVLSHATTGTCTPKNSTANLGKTYQHSQVWPIHTISYYVRKNPGLQSALYRKIDAGNAEELVEGIEQIQILYGVDNDALPDQTPNYYVTAASVSDWNKVLSVRISLLVVSLEDNLADHPVSYVYNSITSAGDRHLRRVFTTTVALRNRRSIA